MVTVGGGLAYGALGYSHHAVQDYALMRLMPNTLIGAPGDPMEVRACMRYLVAHPQPSYLRLGKAGEPSFHATVPELAPGRWLELKRPDAVDGVRRALLTTGAPLAAAMGWAKDEQLADAGVYSLPLWGMRCKSTQAEQAGRVQLLASVEDHLIDGGFGSWLRESLAGGEPAAPRLRTLGLDSEVCGLVGTQETLNRIGGLHVEGARRALAYARH